VRPELARPTNDRRAGPTFTVVEHEAADVDPSGSARRPFEFVVAPHDAELVADQLFGLGASAVSERTGRDGEVVLVADLDPAALDGTSLRARELQDDPTWATAWHDSAQAWRCGDRLVVRPVWVDPGPARPGVEEVEVLLDPDAAFGSGSHPTTRLCLAALEPLAPGTTVLDVGCGTGVLGAAALVLGSTSLVAIDIDPAAVAATRRAGAQRGDERVVSATPLRRSRRFDLVLANLLSRSSRSSAWLVPTGAGGCSSQRLLGCRSTVRGGAAPGVGRSSREDWVALP
jgi:ribosomal protein L11 methyltransferase